MLSGFQPVPKGGSIDFSVNDHDVWTRVRAALKADAGDHSYEAWLAPLAFIGCDGETLRLAAPSAFAADWVTSNYADLLRRHWSQHQPSLRRVAVQQGQAMVATPSTTKAAAPAAAQSLPVDARYSFDNFIVGKSESGDVQTSVLGE